MKIYHWILIIIVTITGIISTLNYFTETTQESTLSETSVEVFYLNEFFNSTITNESVEINNPEIYIGNDTANKMNLFDLVKGKCLVLRFSGEACNVCIDFVINRMKRTFSDFAENDRILLIGSNLNTRVKENYYGKKIISFYSGDLGLPFEEYNTPFLFIIDRDRITKMFFIPEKTMPELTDFYMKNVFERFFNRYDNLFLEL